MKFSNLYVILFISMCMISCGDDESEPEPDVLKRVKTITTVSDRSVTTTYQYTYNTSNRLVELKEESGGEKRYTFYTYTNNTVTRHEHWLVVSGDSTLQEVTDYIYELQKISEVNTTWEIEDSVVFRKYADIASTEVIQRSDSIVFGLEKWIQVIEFNFEGHTGELTTYTEEIPTDTLVFSRNVIYGRVANPLRQWNFPLSYDPHLIKPFAIHDDPLPDVFMTSQFLPISWITDGDIYTSEELFFGYTFFEENSNLLETITRIENSVLKSTSTFEWEDVPQ